MAEKKTDEFIRKTKKTINSILPILQNVALGDFSKKLKIPKEENEFTELLVSINLMIGDLEEYQRDLDGRVREKTKEIKEREMWFRRIFELSPEAIVILDKKGTVVDLNKRVTDWLGYKISEIKGRKAIELPFFPNQSKMIIMKKFAERYESPNKKMQPYDLEFISKKNNKIIGRIYTQSILDEKGGLFHNLVMISDITKEKKKENEILQRQIEIEKMNNLMVGRELKMIELKEKIKKLENN